VAVTTLGRGGPRGGAVLRAVVAVIGVVAVLALIADLVALAITRIEPPAPPAGAARPGVEAREGRAYAGRSWIGRERGLFELHLEGAPRDLGYAHARLGNRLMMAADDELFAELDRALPEGPARWLPRLGVRWRHRHLAEGIPAARLQEVAGEADGYLDTHADLLPTYHRLLFYQALPELNDGLSRPPLCASTSWSAATSTSRGPRRSTATRSCCSCGPTSRAGSRSPRSPGSARRGC